MRVLVISLLIGIILILNGCADLPEYQAMLMWGRMGVRVDNLRCEYRVNPHGIDVVKPRLSWVLNSEQRGQKQTAYRILVASSEEKINHDQGDLWDTGKVNSQKSIQIVYGGRPLESRMSCYWKVRIWDSDSKPSDWSKPAFWTMGLLEQEDFKAEWIGYDAEPSADYKAIESELLNLEGCQWVWFPQGEPDKSATVGTRFFRQTVRIPTGKKIKRAGFRLLVDNEGVLYVNGEEIKSFRGWSPSHTIDVTEILRPGLNTLAIDATNNGNNPNPAGLAGRLVILFETDRALTVSIDRSWKVSDIEQDNWKTYPFDDSSWENAKEIAALGQEPWGQISEGGLVLPPPPYLRKDFSIDKRVRHAMVYASALGLYELHINGKRVGEDYFTPGWTDYPTRVYYQTYDVTKLVEKGDNAIGVILADGWYAGFVGFGQKRENYGSNPRLWLQLEIEYNDGTRKTIVTGKSWKASYGPLMEADFLMGEVYDAQREMSGWAQAGFDDSGWDNVSVTEKISGKLQSYPGVAVQKILQIEPVEITEPKKNIYVFDMGQNFAGWAKLKVKGKAGTRVVMRFAEMLNPDGTIYTENLRSARCTDTYILKGDGTETWEPCFTYHGFRYVEVTGYPGKASLDSLTGIVVHSNTPLVSSFECSNPMVNQLYRNIVWGQRSNFIEVPTDCPQRDERLGWTGDAQIFIRTATYNMDVAAFFTKWLIDLEDAQNENGAFSDVAPRLAAMGDGVPAWGDAGIICPWTIYQVYGDKQVIEQHYEAMKKWIEYLKKNSTNLLRPAYGYGDWVSIGSDTPKDVIATAYFAYSTRLLSKMANAIANKQDAKRYEELFQQIKNAFNEAYVSQDGRVTGDTQTCYLLALHFDLLPESKRQSATRYLIDAIRRKRWHLSTGFVGLSYLLPTLTETGHLDIAYRLLNNDTFPSWGYSIKHGATTIWERWDGWTKEKGFQDPGMNSFNHYAFGAVGRWLFGTVAGIETDGPGYEKIIIRPRPGGSLTYAKASYDSTHGKIVSDWKIDGSTLTLNVTIPANTTATVYVPAKDAGSVISPGRQKSVEGIELPENNVWFLRMDEGAAVFAVDSGSYKFVSKLP
jgi:alpha-L-rhamnosidase